MSEKLKEDSSEKLTEKTVDDGLWGEKYRETVPPFSGDKKQSTSTKSPETNNNKTESDDYYVFEGVEYRNINKIDISTDEGKYEWLDALLENGLARYEQELENAERDFDDEAIEDAKKQLEFIKRQQNILLDKIHIDGEGGIVGALQREYVAAGKNFVEMAQNNKATRSALEVAFENRNAASDLLSLIEGEMARRDPNCFGQSEMRLTLENEVKRAGREVADTMVEGYFGEDGFLHKAPNGEKMPTPATEDAEINLEYAKQDVETFNLLMDDFYQATNNFDVPRAIKKEDFMSTVNNFIDSHTAQLEQLKDERKNMIKGTPEYEENDAKRKKLVNERNSARRLAIKYFNTSQTE